MFRAKVIKCAGVIALVVAAWTDGALAEEGAHKPLRTSSPVVLTDDKLEPLLGMMPRQLVAMSYDGAWREIPVQVDKRVDVLFTKIYNVPLLSLRHLTTLAYTDPATFTGVDTNLQIDSNDEVVLMAADAGGVPTKWHDPPGVVSGSAVMVELADPLQKGRRAWVFLFKRSDGGKRATVRHGTEYTFKLKSGAYRETYSITTGPNPEDSTVKTPFYTRHFSDRWISDQLTIPPPLGSGANLLDMDKILLRPGMALRSVKTFSQGEGAFIANKSGPVRAIRSYTGCNSGPFTQRQFFFYDAREDCHTFLRVHRLPGVLSFTDYSAAAKGMKYYNNINPQGAVVDGVDDKMKNGILQWEMISGSQGTIIIVYQYHTDIPAIKAGLYYLDDANSKVRQVTGDAHAYAASGMWINQAIPNTDPIAREFKKLSIHSIRFYHGPNATVADAKRRFAEITTPLTINVSPTPGKKTAK